MNKISIHVGKTKVMVFASKQKAAKDTNFEINGKRIGKVPTYKYLWGNSRLKTVIQK